MKLLEIRLERDENFTDVFIYYLTEEGYQGEVSARRYRGKVNISWGLPTNRTITNSKIQHEAMGLAIQAAEWLESGASIEAWIEATRLIYKE